MGDLGPTTGANGQKMSLGDQILTLVVQAIAKALQPAATQAQQQPNITVETDGKKKATTPATTTAPTTATGATAGKPSLGDQILGMIGQELVKLGKGSANTAPVDTNKTTKATVPAVTPAPVSQTTTPAVKTATTGDRPAINYGTVNRTQSQSTTTNNGNTNVVNNDKVKVTGNNQRVG
jgi:hypothetical protein